MRKLSKILPGLYTGPAARQAPVKTTKDRNIRYCMLLKQRERNL